MSEIIFSDICKSYSRINLLEDVSITLRKGSVTILAGENGSGKTTLLRILAGLEKPQSCTVEFGDSTRSWKSARRRLLEQIMYLHQRPYMFEGSVNHNLSLALPRALSSKKKSERIREAVEWGMLDRQASEPAKTLSGGQQQRLALARAWLRKSYFLLLDEPISSMDTQSSIRTVKLLQRLKNSGTSLVVCSHNKQVFDSIADQQLDLEKGSLKNAGTLEYGTNVALLDNSRLGDSAAGKLD
jgi:tungstate transport system ATP-binding protein